MPKTEAQRQAAHALDKATRALRRAQQQVQQAEATVAVEATLTKSRPGRRPLTAAERGTLLAGAIPAWWTQPTPEARLQALQEKLTQTSRPKYAPTPR